MYLFNKQGKVLGRDKNGKKNQHSQTLGLTGMKIILSTCRNKSFSGWSYVVPARGVLVGFWSGESLSWRVLSFRMDQVPLEWIRWPVKLE